MPSKCFDMLSENGFLQVKRAKNDEAATAECKQILNNIIKNGLTINKKQVYLPKTFCLPLSAERIFTGFNVRYYINPDGTKSSDPVNPDGTKKKEKGCRVMTSNARPLWLDLQTAEGKSYHTIFKMGDDLRQDQLVIQLLGVMDSLWKAEGIDNDLSLFTCQPTGFGGDAGGIGFVEIVPDSETCAQITGQTRRAFSAGPLLDWFREQAEERTAVEKSLGNEADSAVELRRMQDNFARSCAGYCVGTYVLGIADRHNDNIMVRKDGRFFHIDFGHFLGHFLYFAGINRESAPFVFTSDFLMVLGGDQGEHFSLFIDYCVRSYNILRKNAVVLENLLTMMLHSGLEHLPSVKEGGVTKGIASLLEMLMLNMDDGQAADFFKGEIQKSLKSVGTQINFFFHMAAAKFK